MRRCAVRQPQARCADAACRGRRPHRTGAARPGLHGLVRAAQSAGVRLRVGLARRAVERPHAAGRLRRRRRGPAVGGGDPPRWISLRRIAASAWSRTCTCCVTLWTKDNEPFEGQFTKFANVTLEPKPIAESLSDLACHQRGAAVQGAGGFRRLGFRAQPRRQDRRRLDDAFGQPRRLPPLLGVHPQGGQRRRTRHVGLRQYSLSPHQRERRQGGRARRLRRSSSISITAPTTARSGWRPG